MNKRFINCIILFSFTLSYIACEQQSDLPASPFGTYSRTDKHDGYVAGNGKMYVVGALGKKLTRAGKSRLTNQAISLSRLHWVVGPTYGFTNLGYGWEMQWIEGSDTIAWESEKVLNPEADLPFMGVALKKEGWTLNIRDIPLVDQPIMIRNIQLIKESQIAPKGLKLVCPVFTDPRHKQFQSWNGSLISESSDNWQPSFEDSIQFSLPNNIIAQKGGKRRLYWEPSIENTQSENPERWMLTQMLIHEPGVDMRFLERVPTVDGAFSLDLTKYFQEGVDTLELGLWIATGWTREETLHLVQEKLAGTLPELIERNISGQDASLFTLTDDQLTSPLLESISATLANAEVAQAHFGGVFAQAYMYPMYYHRDMYGPFLVLMAGGKYDRAYDLMAYLIAMENRYGIQNAYDAILGRANPNNWNPSGIQENSHFVKAEVPNFVIMMAQKYYEATNDLEKLEPLYDRLVYNLEVQYVNQNHMLSYQGDESYTNFRETAPRFSQEMTDSGLWYLASLRFLARIAEDLGKKADARRFHTRAVQIHSALLSRLWLKDRGHWAYARDASNEADSIDKRPVLDPLLRWAWLELGDPSDSIYQSCQQVVLEQLTNPLRVVPEWDMCTGMNPGYLLYSLSRSQHAYTHDAAQLMLNYASDAGLYAEYYRHPDGSVIEIQGGTLRPWESSINGYAMIHYLMGFRPNLPEGRIFLQPHFPEGWPGWQSAWMPLGEEGSIRFRMERTENAISYEIERRGGMKPIICEIELGLLGEIVSVNQPLNKLSDILAGATVNLEPGEKRIMTVNIL